MAHNRISVQTIRFFSPALLWGLIILLIIGLPGENIPESGLLNIPHIDKVVHFVLFAVMGALLVYGYRKKHQGRTLHGRQLLICITLGVFYGILTEFLQYCCFSDRHGNVPDAIANGFGTVFGVILSAQLFRKMIGYQEKNQPD